VWLLEQKQWSTSREPKIAFMRGSSCMEAGWIVGEAAFVTIDSIITAGIIIRLVYRMLS